MYIPPYAYYKEFVTLIHYIGVAPYTNSYIVREIKSRKLGDDTCPFASEGLKCSILAKLNHLPM